MSDENQTLNEEELAVLKLVYEFNMAVQAKGAELQQQAQEKAQKLVQQGLADVATLSDAEVDAKLTKMAVEQNPPLTQEQAEKQLTNASREDKVHFLTEADIGNQANGLSEEEIDELVIKEMSSSGDISEADARAKLEELGDMKALIIMQVLPVALKPSQDYNALSDADLDAETVRVLLESNPGTSEADAQAQLDQMGRDQKDTILAQAFAQSAMGEPENPVEIVAEEKDLDLDKLQSDVDAIVDKYGPEVVRNEIGKLAGPTPN